MADLLEGWLRVQGEKFWAMSRAKSVIVNEETGTTLDEVLQDISLDELVRTVLVLQDRFEELEDLVSQLVDNVGVENIQTGVYSVYKPTLDSLIEKGVIDDNVMYILCPSSDSTSRVCVTVKWLTQTGEEIDRDVFYKKIGENFQETVFRTITHAGVVYRYPTETPIIDRGTGLQAKCVTTVATGLTYVNIYPTKNVVLELRAAE